MGNNGGRCLNKSRPKKIYLDQVSSTKPTKKIISEKFIDAKIPTNVIQSPQVPPHNAQSKLYKDQNMEKVSKEQINVDHNKQVQSSFTYPYSAIGYIKSFQTLSEHQIQIGCLIGRNIVLSPAENLTLREQDKQKQVNFKNQQNNRQIYFYLGVNGEISKSAKKIKVKSVYFPQKEYYEKMTYAILQLQTEEDLSLQFGCLRINVIQHKTNQPIYIAGYQKKTTEIHQQYLTLQTKQCQITDISSNVGLLFYETFFEQTKCPIFMKGQNGQYNIIGMHKGTKASNTSKISYGIKINQQNLTKIQKYLFQKTTKNKQQINNQIELHSSEKLKDRRNQSKQHNLNKQKYQQQIKSLQKAIKDNDQSYKLHNELGNIYLKLGNHTKAIHTYKNALKLNKNFDEAYKNLGSVYQKLGRYSQAIDNYKMAIKINQNYSQVYNNLGDIYYAQLQYQKSIIHYKMAIFTNSNYGKANYNMGYAYYAVGKIQQALQCSKRSVQIEPNNKTYKQRVKRLQKMLQYRDTLKKVQQPNE